MLPSLLTSHPLLLGLAFLGNLSLKIDANIANLRRLGTLAMRGSGRIALPSF